MVRELYHIKDLPKENFEFFETHSKQVQVSSGLIVFSSLCEHATKEHKPDIHTAYYQLLNLSTFLCIFQAESQLTHDPPFYMFRELSTN